MYLIIAHDKGLDLMCIGFGRCATRVMTTCVFRLSPRRCVLLALRFAPRAVLHASSKSRHWHVRDVIVLCGRVRVQVNGVARGTALIGFVCF